MLEPGEGMQESLVCVEGLWGWKYAVSVTGGREEVGVEVAGCDSMDVIA